MQHDDFKQLNRDVRLTVGIIHQLQTGHHRGDYIKVIIDI